MENPFKRPHTYLYTACVGGAVALGGGGLSYKAAEYYRTAWDAYAEDALDTGKAAFETGDTLLYAGLGVTAAGMLITGTSLAIYKFMERRQSGN